MTYLKRLLAVLFILGDALCVNAMEQLPVIDRTDKVHERRYLDSLNVYNRRPIRLNQSGFRPQDYKYAYVADPTNMTFKVIDANTNTEVSNGSLSLIKQNAVKPNIWINGAFNSIASVYEFGSLDSISSARENLYRADFTTLTSMGEYYLVVGNDTSAHFLIHPSIFNAILEKSLMFFGIQRCGDTKSHFHGACHLKDGSAIGHDLTGGWHDCGDHFKVSETLGYAAYVLSMVYLTYQDKAEDRYGNSYADTVFTDGIPDILYEAKIGTDYILKLYNASKADGVIAQGDMYHSVGVADPDHAYWDRPERQDAQSPAKGGPDRDVTKKIGANTAGIFAAALANVAVGYKVYDAAYSDSLLAAAEDIYKNVFKVAYAEKRITSGNYYNQFYTGGGPLNDDGAAAAFALWYATKDTTYQYDLYKNPAIYNNANSYRYNLDYFKGGFLGNPSGFTPGGWATDYQNVHSYVLFAMQRLILNSPTISAEYGLSELERDTLSMRTMATFRKLIDVSTNEGDSLVLTNPGIGSGDPHEGPSNLHVITPYNLVWTSFDWGVMRYNMGTAVSIFLMYELTGDERYLKVALDNMYFILGANPWDISFLMGTGDKNPQHPHNRASNPDGYNAGGMPYDYKCPVGALMGARDPNKTLIEDWSKYTSTETCIDFTAQFLFPAQSLAQTLPPDMDGPLFSNIAGTPISDTEAIVSWDANEVALVTVFYSEVPDETTVKSVQQNTATKGGAVTLTGLTPGKTYYFFLEGMDTRRNLTTDNNHGQWYKFTMTPATTSISGVTICQVDNRSAKIYWWSSDRMNGVVNFGTAPGAYTQSKAAEGGAVLFHEATLTNLQAGTKYYFSVSSGATTSSEFSFTTEEYATTVEMDIYVKPLNKNGCSSSSDWKQCNTFLVIVTNRDTMPYQDLDLRFYFPVAVTGGSDNRSIWDGTGQSVGWPTMNFEAPVAYTATTPSGTTESGYYTQVHIEGNLAVSGSYFFEFKVQPSYGSLENSWSFRPHTGSDDPEMFEGIDLTRGPLYKEESNSTMYIETINGVKEKAFRKTPYVTAYYHGKYIYGYAPDYSPETGPQLNRTITLNFDSPFVSPHYSVEQEDYGATYSGTSKVTPTGMLDEFEMNGSSYFNHTAYDPANRKDAFQFKIDTTLVYGNNYMEWVSWHNRAANQNGSYDCACAFVRSNVEIDSIMVPPEIRHLKFTVDTVHAYTGKMVKVKLQLLDSNMALLNVDPISVLLSSETGFAKFYTSLNSTIPVEKIDIIKGEAEFYLSSDKATTTILKAIGNNTSKFNYIPAKAVLIIEDLPPWPIIEEAKMVDSDCDDIPDALNITLSNEYITAENQSFNSIKFVYGRDTITSTNLISQNGKDIVVGANLTGATVNTNPEGSITLISNTKDGKKESVDFYKDGIPPNLVSVSVLERLPEATSDFVYIQFSEPVKEPSPEWPLRIDHNDIAAHVKGVKPYNKDLNIWEFEIDFDAGGGSLVKEGMKAELSPTATIRDLAGNGIGPCTPKVVDVLLKIRPIPMTYASISDLNQDGLAEHVDIRFSQTVDSKHFPDSISIIFGSAAPETLVVRKTQFQLNTDQMSSSFDLVIPFALGNTNGNFEGLLNGREVEGAGMIIEHLGDGAAYETESVLAEDLAGPVFVSASLSSSNTYEVLNVYISEPLVIVDSAAILYVRERGNMNIAKIDIAGFGLPSGKTMLNALYTADAVAAVMEGDRINFAPNTASAFADKNGNRPAERNPKVTVGGEGKPKIKFDIHLEKQVADISSQAASLINSTKTLNLYIVNPSNHKLDRIENGVVVETGIDTTVTPLTGVVWTMDLTVPRGGALNEPAYWRSLKVKYNIPIYTNLGSYVNRASGTYTVNSDEYFSTNNKVTFFVEWVNSPAGGVKSQQGRAVGTGAYIYKAELECKFLPNPDLDMKTKERFDTSNSYDKTETFGIKRTK